MHLKIDLRVLHVEIGHDIEQVYYFNNISPAHEVEG